MYRKTTQHIAIRKTRSAVEKLKERKKMTLSEFALESGYTVKTLRYYVIPVLKAYYDKCIAMHAVHGESDAILEWVCE